MASMNQQDLLTIEHEWQRAATGKRFLNYLIDLIFFYILIFAFGLVAYSIWPREMEDMANEDSLGFNLLDRLFTLIAYALYMGVQEGLFKGKSLGKFFTRTRAVQLDGSAVTWSKAFSRGFSRAVPFVVFSAFGSPCSPWQDTWTDTAVIDEKAGPLAIAQ